MALDLDGQKLADALQKSHEDFLGFCRMMARAGAKFSPKQKTQIRAMAANNNTFAAQLLILDELKDQFKDTDK